MEMRKIYSGLHAITANITSTGRINSFYRSNFVFAYNFASADFATYRKSLSHIPLS